MPGVTEWLFGSSPKLQKKPTGTNEQQAFGQNILQQLMQMQGQGGGQQLSNQYYNNLLGGGEGGQQGALQQFSQPYLQQFQEQILPGIEERYAGMGALSSSGFGQALGGAASGLQSQLAQLFSSLQGGAAQQQYGQYNQQSQLGLNYQPFAYHEKQGTVGAVIPMLSALIQGLAGK